MNDIVYQVRRSDRRSISIKIDSRNLIIVSAPRNCSAAEIEQFVKAKRGWIEKHVSANNAKNSSLSGIIEYKNILVAGKTLPFTVGVADNFSLDSVCVKNIKHLKKLYVENLGGIFMDKFNAVSQKTGLSSASVGFKDYKARWGCCDRKRNILFNYKLLMLPEKYWTYVILHELCHTVYMNHSKSFYSLMASFMPEYKKLRTEMKFYTRIAALY